MSVIGDEKRKSLGSNVNVHKIRAGVKKKTCAPKVTAKSGYDQEANRKINRK